MNVLIDENINQEKIDNVGEALNQVDEFCPNYPPLEEAKTYHKNVKIWGTSRIHPSPDRISEHVIAIKKHLEENIQPEFIAASLRALCKIVEEKPEERARCIRDFHLLGDICRILDKFPLVEVSFF